MKELSMREVWIFAACLAAVVPTWGQDARSQDAGHRIDFAATWRLDLKKSNLGSDHPDVNYGFTKTFELKGSTIVQKDHEVNVDIVGYALPERNSNRELVPDGREQTIQTPGLFPGMPPTSTRVIVEWQGDNLVMSESSESMIGSVKTSRRYYLSEDGTELVERVTSHTTYSDSEQRLVFARVPDSH